MFSLPARGRVVLATVRGDAPAACLLVQLGLLLHIPQPCVGKHLAFDGRLLHGAPPELARGPPEGGVRVTRARERESPSCGRAAAAAASLQQQ